MAQSARPALFLAGSRAAHFDVHRRLLSRDLVVAITAIHGPNFSGRTAKLREWAGLPSAPEADAHYTNSAYVHLDTYNYFTGLAPTVATEIQFQAVNRWAAQTATKALCDLGFSHCMDVNPFVLSGGEQVVAAIVAAIAGQPKRLAIDCALEQLAAPTRERLLSYLSGLDMEVQFADNRLGDWWSGRALEMGMADTRFVLDSTRYRQHTPPPPLIELVDICHSYVQDRPVLSHLNLRLEPGKTYLLQGPNGSGKSTLCKILTGLIKPSRGEIRMDGHRFEPWRRPGQDVGYHFQDPNFQLFGTKVSSQLAADRTDVSNAFGLDGLWDAHPLDLPYVLKKRLAIASALSRGRRFNILDEPTLGQDDDSVVSLNQILVGQAGILVSHSALYDHLPTIVLG